MSETTTLLCDCQTEGYCQAHGTRTTQINDLADQITAAHNRMWADNTHLGGMAVYGLRLEGFVGGAWYSDGTYGLGQVVTLRVGRHYTADEVANEIAEMLGS